MLNLKQRWLIATICTNVLTASSPLVAQSKSTKDLVEVAIPVRPAKASGGSVVIKQYEKMTPPAREAYIRRQVLRGNIPNFLRDLVPMTIEGYDRNNVPHKLQVQVMRDYLALGSNSDFVRIPTTPVTAQKIADAFHMMLPTTKLVDDFYAAAATHLRPQHLPASRRMSSANYILAHDRGIQKALKNPGTSAGLIAGHKKDIVITRRMLSQPRRVAIYGWHRGLLDPIQPLSLVHGITYLDYSHGVRLVARRALLDGKVVDLMAVLRDPILTSLLQDETTNAPKNLLAYEGI